MEYMQREGEIYLEVLTCGILVNEESTLGNNMHGINLFV